MCFLLKHYDHYIMPGTNKNVHSRGNGRESCYHGTAALARTVLCKQTLKTQIRNLPFSLEHQALHLSTDPRLSRSLLSQHGTLKARRLSFIVDHSNWSLPWHMPQPEDFNSSGFAQGLCTHLGSRGQILKHMFVNAI